MSSNSQVSTLTAIGNKPGTSKPAEELASVVDMLEDYGRVLILDREGYARTLGFEALAGLLNINLVDRERARRARTGRMVPLGRSGCHRGAGLHARLPADPVARAANGWPHPQESRPGCSLCEWFARGRAVAGPSIQAGIHGIGCWSMQA